VSDTILAIELDDAAALGRALSRETSMATNRPASRCWAIRRPTCLCERRRTLFVACRERRAAIGTSSPQSCDQVAPPRKTALRAGNATRCHGAPRIAAPNDAVPICSPRTDRHVVACTTIAGVRSRRFDRPSGHVSSAIRAELHFTRRQNLKRVRPPGSVPNATVAERGSTRYTCHGGGP
jgi:hypothetical protein